MRKQSHSFVRAHRRRWGLTQAELATLLGIAASTSVSRVERAVRPPTASVMIACSILFGVPGCELFASFSETVEAVVANAAKDLYDALEDRADERSLRKREFLQAALLRIAGPEPASKI